MNHWKENQGIQPAETHDKEIQIETRRGNVSTVSANSIDWTLRQVAEDVVCYRLIGDKS